MFDKSHKCAEPLPPRISSNKKFQSINFITSPHNLYYSISKCIQTTAPSTHSQYFQNKFHLTLGFVCTYSKYAGSVLTVEM